MSFRLAEAPDAAVVIDEPGLRVGHLAHRDLPGTFWLRMPPDTVGLWTFS
jgi:hypothetical protein